MKAKDEWVEIGVVGVDSGQLMVCDPCYIESDWKHGWVKYEDKLRVVSTEELIPSPRKTGKTYDDIYKDGLTYNQAIEKGILAEEPEEETGEFSYDGCCKKTINKSHGQLNFNMGHAGAGVVFNSGFGDGVYPVFARIKDFGEFGKRIVEVKIVIVEE
jgi:hypothetical protein